MSEENENVPNNITDNTCGNMEIESDINSIMDLSNQKKSQNINQKKNETNSLNKTAFHSSIKFKTKQKYSSKLKGDNSNQVRYKIKNSLSLKNSLKAHKSKNKQDIEDSKKLSINQKNSQSDKSFKEESKEKIQKIKSETNLSKINEKIDISEDEDEKFENSSEINKNVNIAINNNESIVNNIINNEIHFQYITVKNNIKDIINNKSPSLISITYEEFGKNMPAFEYLNDIWDSFIEKEKFNNYSLDEIVNIQTDIKDTMRCILIDWIISLQNKFFRKSNTLFLTINLIDRYISKKPIHRTKFQLLGVTSLFIAYKYEEIYMKNINDFVDLTARAFDKTEILNMEKIIIDLVEFNLDLPLSNDFFDLLSTVYKFDKKEYYFGCFLLEAFLLDINCCKYKQSQIALATCFIVLGLRQMKRINPIEGNNFIKYYCNEYKINFEIWKEYDTIVDCAKKIYFYFEHSDQIKYREVYNIFNYLFI